MTKAVFFDIDDTIYDYIGAACSVLFNDDGWLPCSKKTSNDQRIS